jgi:hypothetical protein
VIRLDNHEADNRYITGAYLASVFSKNGLKLSFSNLKLLVDNYSVPKDILAKDPTLVEVHPPPPPAPLLLLSPPLSLSLPSSLLPQRLNRILPSDDFETTLEEEGGLTNTQLVQKQLKLKYQTLQRTLRIQDERSANNLTLPQTSNQSSYTKPGASHLTISRDEDLDNAAQEKDRKSAMFTRSILRTKTMENQSSGRGIADEEAELSQAVINYHNLCNDIYICDWR